MKHATDMPKTSALGQPGLEGDGRYLGRMDSEGDAGTPNRGRFKGLLPNLGAAHKQRPFQTELLVTACNVVQYAFGAYRDPEVEAYIEETIWGASIHHLNTDLSNATVDGVLKIQLEKAAHVADQDNIGGGSSDPYVVFSAGSTQVESEVVRDSTDPIWNSTHYIIIKKRYARSDFDGKLNVALFDKDTQSGFLGSIASYMNRDDHLGSAQIDLAELKKPGRHSFDLELKTGNSGETAATVSFATEFISFKQACKEMGYGTSGADALPGLGSIQDPVTTTSDLSWIVELRHLRMEPFAFIDVPSTDSQAWIHVNASAKALLISFRGTEIAKMRDILIDITAYSSTFESTSDDVYTLNATDILLERDLRVHSGFLEAYESIREAVLQIAYELTNWSEDWRICVTGHSLGGALATLCAFEFANRKTGRGVGPGIAMMNFGTPRVGNHAFARAYNESVPDSFRVVEQHDIVHLIPPLYFHADNELLLLPNGDAFVEGIHLNDIDPATLHTDSKKDVERHEAGRLRAIVGNIVAEFESVADKHLSENYFAIIRAAAGKFFGEFERLATEE